jgi:hypothetical protein
MQTSKPANPQTGNKLDKYSTYIRADYKKELKRLALETDRSDYEVLEEAVAFYLQHRKAGK